MKKSPILKLSLLVAGSLLTCGLLSDGQSAPASAPQLAPPTSSLSPLPVPPSGPEIQPLAHRDLALIQRLTPRVEIWRPNSNRPQIPARRSERGNADPAFVTGTEPLTIRLQFNPQSAGEHVTVIAARGILLDPPQQVLTISARGDCTFLVQLKEGASRGHLITYCHSVRTVVPLTRAPLRIVEAWEAQGGGPP